MMGASASCASMPYLLASLLYCSMYRRTVAPLLPVPLRRKMMREPSARPHATWAHGRRGRSTRVEQYRRETPYYTSHQRSAQRTAWRMHTMSKRQANSYPQLTPPPPTHTLHAPNTPTHL